MRQTSVFTTFVGLVSLLLLPCVAQAAERPVWINEDGIIREGFIEQGQVELDPKHRGWYEARGEAAEFKMSASWYELYRPRCSTSGDGKTLVSFHVHHINNSRRSPPDVVNVELVLDSKTAKVLSSELKAKVGGEVFKTDKPISDPKARGVLEGLELFEGFLKRIGAKGGQLQLPTVVKHCANAVLVHAHPPGWVPANETPIITNDKKPICMMRDGKKCWIPGEIWRQVLKEPVRSLVRMPEAEFDGVPDGRAYVPDRTFLRNNKGTVAVVWKGQKRWVPGDVFPLFKNPMVIEVPNEVWDAVPDGDAADPALAKSFQ
jgi:hypothetical protein